MSCWHTEGARLDRTQTRGTQAVGVDESVDVDGEAGPVDVHSGPTARHRDCEVEPKNRPRATPGTAVLPTEDARSSPPKGDRAHARRQWAKARASMAEPQGSHPGGTEAPRATWPAQNA